MPQACLDVPLQTSRHKVQRPDAGIGFLLMTLKGDICAGVSAPPLQSLLNLLSESFSCSSRPQLDLNLTSTVSVNCHFSITLRFQETAT